MSGRRGRMVEILGPVDLELLAGGYVRSPDGRALRVVRGVERIAGVLADRGAEVVWGRPPGGRLACSYLWRSLVVLSPRVYRLGPGYVCDVLSHEAGHLVVGVSCPRVRLWQVERFGDLLPELRMEGVC